MGKKVEVNLKDIFNIGWILFFSGCLSLYMQTSIPPGNASFDGSTQIAGIGIVIYTSIQFYKAGREGR